MLSDYVSELFDATVELERSENLMRIFFEFAEESNIPKDKSFEEQKTSAYIFAERFPMFESLISTVFDIVEKEKNKIDQIIESLYDETAHKK